MEYTLIGVNGNAFAIMGYVQKAMQAEGYSSDEIKDYLDDAMKIDYNYLVSKSLDMIHNINLKKREENKNGI